MIHNLTVTGKIPGKPLGEEQRRGNVKVYLSVWSDLIDTFEEAGINVLDVGHGENYHPFFQFTAPIRGVGVEEDLSIREINEQLFTVHIAIPFI